MTTSDVLSVAAAVIVSLGGAGLIIIALSSWLGKIWATRIMDRERAEHARELERLRDELRLRTDATLERFKRELDREIADATRDKHDKLQIYRSVADITAGLLAALDAGMGADAAAPDMAKLVSDFNRERMRVYGYMAMHAPQQVMDANDALIDHLFDVLAGEKAYEWAEVRTLVIAMLNQIRADIGIDKTPIEYRGRR